MNPGKSEGSDFILVGEKIWNMVKKTYGGGPDIQFFCINDEKIIEDEALYGQQNFIYHNDYTMYGYPDRHPEYYNVELQITTKDSGVEETFTIPYRLLLSKSMTLRSVIYFIATKLKIDISNLNLVLTSEGNDPVEMSTENGVMTLDEVHEFFGSPKFLMKYNGSSSKYLYRNIIGDIGTFINQDVYEFFDLTRPLSLIVGGENSSTEAVADGYEDDRDELNDADIFDTNIQINNFIDDNQVPPEYANDPDLWYAIQSSLKVTLKLSYFRRIMQKEMKNVKFPLEMMIE